jgi:hydrogenase-4 component B
MAGLVLLCLAIGLGSAPVVSVLQGVSRQITGFMLTASAVEAPSAQTVAVHGGISSVSGLTILALVAAAGLAIWIVARYGLNRRQKITVGNTWDCGTPLNGRMEITATGFARSIYIMFTALLRPSLHQQVEYHDQANPFSVRARKVSMTVHDLYQGQLYAPAYHALLICSRQVKRVQNGNLNTYVLYIFVILILTLLVRT